ncbi:MAG: filamentous hemagglutinin N-terminal domain-containing protein [Rhodocyclaceae bacterium]|nr:filamentous hemagglutinin N-terminal domain-containing protein [Rhodocyclaceae bacterium]
MSIHVVTCQHPRHQYLALLLLLVPLAAAADVVTDGSVGMAGALTGPNFQIPESLGTIRGRNLLHSFSRFNVGATETASFSTTTALDNVIARVTGGAASIIEGTVRLTPASGSPSFFFINPAGIIVSGAGNFDVPGSLHLSTADSLRFSDGSVLSAKATGASTLSVASPEAFGFLPGNTSPIAAVGGATVSAPGSLVTLDAADILVQAARVTTADGNRGLLRTTAVGSAPESDLLRGTPSANGRLVLLDNGRIQTASSLTDPAASIRVQGGNILISGSGSGISMIENRGDHVGAAEKIRLENDIKLDIANSELSIRDTVKAIENGFYGDSTPPIVTVTATGNIDIIAGDTSGIGTGIGANTTAQAVNGAGLLAVLVGGRLTLRGPYSRIEAVNGQNTIGAGGLIGIDAAELRVEGLDPAGRLMADPIAYTGIQTSTRGAGNAGFVFINLSGQASVVGNAIIRSDTQGSGNAGGVVLTVRDLVIDGIDVNSGLFTGIATGSLTPDAGTGGLIGVTATRDIRLSRGSQIASDTLSRNFAGAVSIEAGRELALTSGSTISSDARGDGQAGAVVVKADTVRIDGQGVTSLPTGVSSIAVSGTGTAGLVGVEASRRIVITGAGVVRSDTFGDGSAGLVKVVTSGELQISGAGVISSDTYGDGDAGVVLVRGGRILIDGAGSAFFTGISSDALAGSGNAGNLALVASRGLRLVNGGAISSSTSTPGRAGNILFRDFDPATGEFVPADTPVIRVEGSGPSGPSRIAALATSTSGGGVGSVLLEASRLIAVENGGKVSIENAASTPDGLGSDGQLVVIAPVVRLVGAPFGLSSASFGNIGAAPITVAAPQLLFLRDSRIITESVEGNGGSITAVAAVAYLGRSQVTTSVTGSNNGNGGDILFRADRMVLNNGFILANTLAPAGSGGLVQIATNGLFASAQSLLRGGDLPVEFVAGKRGLNVIQAAAPGGLSGEIAISAPPTIDVTGSLLSLQAPRIGDVRIGRDPCDDRSGSSLLVLGRGGPPCSASDPLGRR